MPLITDVLANLPAHRDSTGGISLFDPRSGSRTRCMSGHRLSATMTTVETTAERRNTSHLKAKAAPKTGCYDCSSPFNLLRCPMCDAAYFCGAHNPANSHAHAPYCRAVDEARQDLHLAGQAHARRRPRINTHPYSEVAVARRTLADTLSKMSTQKSVDEAVRIWYYTSRETCRTYDFWQERFDIPRDLLRLGRLEECYYYVKFWTRFAGLRVSRVAPEEYLRPSDGTNIWGREEEMQPMSPIVPRGGGTTLNCLLVTLMVKLSLLINIKELQSAAIVGRHKRLGTETICHIQSYITIPAFHRPDQKLPDGHYRPDVVCDPLGPYVQGLRKDALQLRAVILRDNRWVPYMLGRARRCSRWYDKDSEWWPWGEQPPERPPLSYAADLWDEAEAKFATYPNAVLLEGHLGRAVEWALGPFVTSEDAMYGPGNGWLGAEVDETLLD